MRLAQWLWGLAFLAGGTLVAVGALPGADGWATGPRIGIAMTLVLLGGLVWGFPLAAWLLRRTTTPDDYAGTCPVGRSCPACDAFNLYPRTTCRVCRVDLDAVTPRADADRQPL